MSKDHAQRARPAVKAVALGLAISAGLTMSACRWSPITSGTSARQKTEAREFVVRADAMLVDGKPDEALYVLARAIEKNPRLTVAHLKMGEILKDSGDYAAAADAFGAAAELEPRDFDAQYNHGLMLHLINRMSEAVSAYIRALTVRPEDFDANFNLATAYLQLNEANQSEYYARQAVRLNPQHGPSHANLGAVYSALDRHEKAVREYESAAELMMLSPDILVNWAESLGKLGRYDEMAVTLESVLDEQSTAAVFERLGFARFKLRQYEGAQSAFRRSLEADETYYPALNGLGVCLLNEYLLSGKQDMAVHREAMGLFTRSLRMKRDQARIQEIISRYKF